MKRFFSMFAMRSCLRKASSSGLRKASMLGLMCCLLVSCVTGGLEPNSFPEPDKHAVLSSRSLQLLDSHAVPVSEIGPGFAGYMLSVDCDGAWEIDVQDGFVALGTAEGTGPDTLQLLVCENWGESRSCTLNFMPDNKPAESLLLVQKQSLTMPENMSRLSAVRGTGFSYFPSTNLANGIDKQIFNIEELRQIQSETGIHLFADDYYPQNSVTVYTSDSIEGIENQIAVSVGLEVGVYGIKVGIKGSFASSSESTESSKYGYMNLRRSYFTREIQYKNAVALAMQDSQMFRRMFAPGFRRELEDFIESVKQESDPYYQMEYCRAFVDHVGVGFVQKSVLGCSMEYLMSINDSYLHDTISISGTLSASFGEVFSIISMEGIGSYSSVEKEASKNAHVSVTARGGDTGFVGITSAGGKVDWETLQKWQMSVSPDNAVLVDINLLPLYCIIPDKYVAGVLENYYEKELRP